MTRTALRSAPRPRSLAAVAALSLAAIATFVPAAARAEGSTTEPPSAADGSSLPRFAVLGRAGVDSGSFGLGATFAADVMVRAREGLLFGGSFELGTRVTGLEGCDTLAHGCDVARQRVGARAELHLAPRASLDPWFGAYFGLVHLRYRDGGTPAGLDSASLSVFGGEVRAEAGLDVRVRIALHATELRFGPVLAAGAAKGDDARLYAGLRAGLAF